MQDGSRLIERRKFKRFSPKRPFLAVSDNIIGQVIDISEGGLGIRYVGDDLQEGGEQEILLIADKEFYLDQLPVKIIADFPTVGDSVQSEFKMRQRGLEFGDLTLSQKEQLKKFIRLHTEH